MTTPRTRAIVSLAATMTLAFAVGACAPGPARPGPVGPAPVTEDPLAIRFENAAREHVHVDLVAGHREWLLGRVEAGARTTLRFPEAALTTGPGTLQLAVIAGEGRTFEAARHPRALFTVAQPAPELLSQRWTLAHGQLASLPLARPGPGAGAGADAGRP